MMSPRKFRPILYMIHVWGVFLCFSAFKENIIEGDGPKNQTQSKMDLYETTINAVLVNWL